MRHRVLHVLPRFETGGAERLAVNLIKTTDPSRFQVHAASLYDPTGTDLEDQLEDAGVPVTFLGKKSGLDLRMVRKLDQEVRRVRPHVIHTHLSVLRYCLPSIVLRHVPVAVHTVHNVAEKEVDRVGRLVHHLAFRVGVTPVAIAGEVAASLRRVYRISEFPTIPNGIPVELFRSPQVNRNTWRVQQGFAPNDVIFACIARLSSQKNHCDLLKAFALGPALHPLARLILVGTGALQTDLMQITAELDLSSKVRFMGLRTDIPEILNAADVFVLSSDWEGNPLTIMEAMAAGKAVISTSVGGVPELVASGTTGLLVPARDVQALTDAMSRLLIEPELRSQLGARAQETSARFDLVHMTKAYEDLYVRLLAKK